MRKKIIIGVVVILSLALLSLFFLMPKGPDLALYEFLKQPRITKMPDRKMLVVTAKGDPNLVGSKAFKLLFQSYYKVPNASKSPAPAPRARWVGDMNVKSSWTGYYALPVPEATEQLPVTDAGPELKIELSSWAYGDVAEILHVGPYAEEKPTIEKLHRFIQSQGYRIVGEHEEEYIQGPVCSSRAIRRDTTRLSDTGLQRQACSIISFVVNIALIFAGGSSNEKCL